jgi:alpha-galactosidase
MDISDNWQSMVANMDTNATLSAYAGPGQWNDPDMLEVGNGGMTTTEYRAHFTMWCMMAAPLILGNDLRSTSQAIKGILTNAEVIGIDQDAAGIQGTRVKKSGNLEVWCKPLGSTNGSTKAVALLNRGTVAATIVVNWSDIGLSGYGAVRDLWAHQDLGYFNGSFAAVVPSHGVVALGIAAADPPRLAVLPNGLPIHLRAYGISNATIVVQTSTNLADWLPLLTNTPATDVWDFLDTNTTEPQKFYRFVMP